MASIEDLISEKDKILKKRFGFGLECLAKKGLENELYETKEIFPKLKGQDDTRYVSSAGISKDEVNYMGRGDYIVEIDNYNKPWKIKFNFSIISMFVFY